MHYNPSTVLASKMQNDFNCCDEIAITQLQDLSSEIFRHKHTVKTLKKTNAYIAASNYFELEDFYLQTLINIIL